ncbi:hypothetical protein [Salipiger thiooxidans]|nr:hypothetical protein [Salipiger thiooxidans]
MKVLDEKRHPRLGLMVRELVYDDEGLCSIGPWVAVRPRRRGRA